MLRCAPRRSKGWPITFAGARAAPSRRAVPRWWWALGVEGPVTSPTVAIANSYQGRVPVAHLDAWRLGDPDDEELGLALEAVAPDSIAFVEWPDSVLHGLPHPRVRVDIAHGGGDVRGVRLDGADPGMDASLEALCDDLRARHRNA